MTTQKLYDTIKKKIQRLTPCGRIGAAQKQKREEQQKMIEKYNEYVITSGYTGKAKCFFVDKTFIFLTIEEAKRFCDTFTNKKELIELVKGL